MIDRIWLDWSAPCLPAAAAWLIDRSTTTGRLCTLDHLLCVLPGRRAGRLLIAELLRQCESKGAHLVPPRTATPGAMVDMIVATDAALATDAESVLAWTRALQECDAEGLRPLVPVPPPADDLLAWRDVARTIHRLHGELAGDGLGFTAVAEQAERMELMREGDRWRALDTIHAAYRRILESAGLADAHESRWNAANEPIGSRISHSKSQISDSDPHPFSHLILVGVVELNRIQQHAATLVPRVTALVHAPESMSAMFDEFGCVLPRAWERRVIEIDPDRMVVADRPQDQGEAALQALGGLAGRFRADQVTIGFAGSDVEEAILHAAEWAEAPLHRADGSPLNRTGPYRLLEQLAVWLGQPCFSSFASLLRHPHLEDWLHRKLESRVTLQEIDSGVHNWITLLDEYFADYLHERFSGAWLSGSKRRRELGAVYDAVRELLGPLPADEDRAMGDWSGPALDVLREVYGGAELELDETTEEACVLLRDALAAQQSIEPSLQPRCDAALALRLALEAAAAQRIAPPVREHQVETLGWLELHLDPAPALILAGVNDGDLPQAVVGDAFLPDGLREKLGLTCNANRYARDAYLLEAVASSREHVTLITGRRAADGQPLTPSRLLLACGREELPERILRLCDAKRAVRWPVPIGAPAAAESCAFVIPPPPDGPVAIEKMSVTSFRLYLACPYRFWLSTIQKLKAFEDRAAELDAMQFGNFAHDVLKAFALEPSMRECGDADAIAAWLRREADRFAQVTFGDAPLPAVVIQLDRLKSRLDAFARIQAECIDAGWRTVQSEFCLPDSAHLDAEGGPIRITGRIDRIDRNDRLDRWRIIDYKTGDTAKTPDEMHLRGPKDDKEWIDLQLPLYRHLAAQAGFEGEIEVGYINLPKKTDKVAYCQADWTAAQFEEAIDLARDIVRDIRAGNFELNHNFAGFDDFENICQTKAIGGDAGALNGDDDDEGDAT